MKETQTYSPDSLLPQVISEPLRRAGNYSHKKDVAPIGIYVRDYDYRQNAYSIRKVLKLLGHTPEQIAALNDAQLLELLHPEDRPRLLKYLAEFAEAKDGEVRELEYRVSQPDGSWNWFYSRDQVLSRDTMGAVRQLVGVVVDLTAHQQRDVALRASEEFNRNILESSADCIKLLDLEGKLLSMNTPGLCLMEIDDFAPFFGKTWSEVWPAEGGALAREAIRKAQNGETAHFRGLCPTAKGTPKWWDVMVSPILDDSGRPQRLVSVSRDITSFRESERALIESEKKLRMATIGAQLGLWFWNLETDELVWTEVCKKLFGLPPHE
ncbi:MAG: PAS domain-containing protein, partial [Acidobacteria bacterium]|nr:PAS domain-containing protein [Acidobacteriota bacterium]